MSLQGSQSYDKYFRVFLGNRERGDRYQLVLMTEVVCGVPSALAGKTEVDGFDVALESGTVRQVAWGRLLSASKI